MGIIYEFRPIHRSIISLAVGVLLFLLFNQFPLLLRLLIGWMGFAFAYNLLCWIVMLNAPIELIRKKAAQEDGSKAFVFSMIILATFASMFAVLILIISNQEVVANSVLIPIVIITMSLSWVLVHTIFTFHYAHRYYKDGSKGQGLEFPGNSMPDYLDFAYFSFTIGCTFQVSDVEVSSKSIRRLVLFHGLLAFALNTFVLALTINIVAGLSK